MKELQWRSRMLKSNEWNWQWSNSWTPSQGRGNNESSNLIGHENYHHILIGGWKPFSVSLNRRIFILNSIGWSNHPWFPLVNERWGGHWLKGRISINFHWTRKTNLRKGHGKLLVFEILVLCFWEEEKNLGKGGEWMCERKFSLLCVKKCYSWKQWCANKKNGRK